MNVVCVTFVAVSVSNSNSGLLKDYYVRFQFVSSSAFLIFFSKTSEATEDIGMLFGEKRKLLTINFHKLSRNSWCALDQEKGKQEKANTDIVPQKTILPQKQND